MGEAGTRCLCMHHTAPCASAQRHAQAPSKAAGSRSAGGLLAQCPISSRVERGGREAVGTGRAQVRSPGAAEREGGLGQGAWGSGAAA